MGDSSRNAGGDHLPAATKPSIAWVLLISEHWKNRPKAQKVSSKTLQNCSARFSDDNMGTFSKNITRSDVIDSMIEIGRVKLSNRLIMAPMAGITNLSFRLLMKKMGAGLVTTEMISAMGLMLGQKRSFDYLKSHPDERPLATQIFGDDPDAMARAAQIAVESGADIVDINMGCPAKKVVKTGAGGALLQHPERVKEIVCAVRRVCSAPLTVKIRAGWSPDKPVAGEIAHLAEDCGADAITLHPRFVTQGFSGNADWRIIAKVKEKVRIPVIGSGDVLNASMAIDMRIQTGCDGVMIGRGAMGNPWIFRQINDLDKGLSIYQPELHERRALIMEHFQLLCVHMGKQRASKVIRGLVLWYTKGLPHSSRFRGSFVHIRGFDSLISALDQYFSYLGGSGS